MMEFISVASSNLSGVHYAADTRTLTVEFKNGSQYKYEGVPPEDYDDLMSAPSKGAHFNDYIKNQYRATRA